MTDGSFVGFGSLEDVESGCQSLSMIEVEKRRFAKAKIEDVKFA